MQPDSRKEEQPAQLRKDVTERKRRFQITRPWRRLPEHDDLVSSTASRENGRGNHFPSGQRAGPRLTDGGGPLLLDRNCKHPDIDPFAYLRDVLRRRPAHPADQLDELLPDVWFASHPSARRKAAA